MAELNSRRFGNVYKILSEHNFCVIINIPDRLKCAKCDKILANACQVPCGCRYCFNCIKEMMTNECQVCPGHTKFCRNEQISNYQTDYSSNREILQLVVKCPEELCTHECELINMEEHLRLCSNKNIPCPFYGLGCNEEKLRNNKIDDHLQLEGFNHNKILLELIENLRNEVNFLKGSNEANKEEIQSNKQEIQSHQSQIEILQENARMKDQTISVMQQQIRSIQVENQQMAAQIKNLKVQSDNKIANLTQEMTKEWRDNLGTEVRKMNGDMEKWQLQLTKRTTEVEKWQDKQIDGTGVMKIDKIKQKLQNGYGICSGIFYPRIEPYKMQLEIVNYAGKDEVEIRLLIHVGERDKDIKWPFKGNVTIEISNKAHPNVSNTITKYCQIDKPNNNSCKWCDPFIFSYVELLTAGLMQDNYLIVECQVK